MHRPLQPGGSMTITPHGDVLPYANSLLLEGQTKARASTVGTLEHTATGVISRTNMGAVGTPNPF